MAVKIQYKKEQNAVKASMKAAYEQDTYAEAKTALLTICTDLDSKGYHSAAKNSLREGLEDTLTLHRFGVGKATAYHESHRACKQPDQAVEKPGSDPAADRDGCAERGATTE